MLANFFSKTNSFNILVLAGFFCFFYAGFLYVNEGFFFAWPSLVEKLGHLFFNLLFLFLSGKLFLKISLSNGNLYACFLIVLLFSLFNGSFEASIPLLVSLLGLVSYMRLLDLHREPDRVLFDSGMLLGGAFLVFNGALLSLFWLAMTLVGMRKATLRNLLLVVVGFSTPVFLFFVVAFLSGDLHRFHALFSFDFSLDCVFYKIRGIFYPAVSLLILNAFALLFLLPSVLSKNPIFRAHFLSIAVLFLTSLGMLGLTGSKNGGELLYLFLPSGVLLACFIESLSSKWLQEVLLLGFAVGALGRLFF